MDILVFFSTPKQVELLHAPVLLTGDFALILYTRRAPLPVIRSGAHNSTYIEVKQPQLAMYFRPFIPEPHRHSIEKPVRDPTLFEHCAGKATLEKALLGRSFSRNLGNAKLAREISKGSVGLLI